MASWPTMSGAHWTVSNATAANRGMVEGFYYAKFRARPEALRALRAFVKAHAPSAYYGEQDSVQASATGSDGYHDWKKETVRYSSVKDKKGKLRWKLRSYDPHAMTERVRRLSRHEAGGNPSVKKPVKRARKPSFKRGDFVRVKGLGTWVGKITFGPQLDKELGLKKWKVTRDFDGLQKWWNDTSLEKLSKKGSRHERAGRHEAGKNPLTKREFDTLTKMHGGTASSHERARTREEKKRRRASSGLASDELDFYRRTRGRPMRGSGATGSTVRRDLLAERAAERARHPTTSLRGLQSAPKAAGGMAYLRSWGESISKRLKGDPHQLSTMSREELRAYRGGAGKKDAMLRARIDKLLGKK